MATLTPKTMTQPIPDPTNWTAIIEVAMSLISGLIAWIYLVNWYFKSKKQEKKEWIEQIATASVNAAMDSCLKDVRDDIKVLFKYREDDRNHIDNKFNMIMTEIRK